MARYTTPREGLNVLTDSFDLIFSDMDKPNSNQFKVTFYESILNWYLPNEKLYSQFGGFLQFTYLLKCISFHDSLAIVFC